MDNIRIINGDLEYLCEEIGSPEGFETPTSRSVLIDLPEQEGALFIDEKAGRRVMSWRGLIKEDIQVTRRLLSRVCYPGGLKTLQFTTCDGVPVQTEAILTLLNPYREDRHPYLINAVAPNPYFLSQDLHSISTLIQSQLAGTPIPAAIPTPILGGSSPPVIVTNAGDTYAKPVFQIRGPGTNFLIRNLDTNEKINLNLTLGAGEVVTIDTTTNEVLKGSQSVFGSVVRTPLSSWIRLRPGTNRISFTANSGVTTATQLTISWRDTFAGV